MGYIERGSQVRGIESRIGLHLLSSRGCQASGSETLNVLP